MEDNKKSRRGRYLTAAALGLLGAAAVGTGLGYAYMSRPGRLVMQDPATAQAGLGDGTISTNARLQEQTEFSQAPIGNIVYTTTQGMPQMQNPATAQANIGKTSRTPRVKLGVMKKKRTTKALRDKTRIRAAPY